MFSRVLKATAVALAASGLVSAQTHTDCNPMKKTCPDDAALSKSMTIDFTKGPSDFFKEAIGTKITYDGEGAKFIINKDKEAPTVTSQKYIFFGKVEVEMKAAPGAGIISSLVLQSDNLDEIDYEWVGSDDTQVQTNYFGKGDDSTFDRGKFHSVSAPAAKFHKYGIEYTAEKVTWTVDGAVVRTLNYQDAKGGSRFPQTPMQIKLGTWVAGGPDSPEGTKQWAGGATDFKQAPFTCVFKSITIEDYSNGVKGATAYKWNPNSDGSYQSIKVLTTPDDNVGATTTSAPASASSSAPKDASSKADSKTTLQSVTQSSSSAITQATAGPKGGNTTESGSSNSGSNSGSGSNNAGAAPSATTSAAAGAKTSAVATSGAFQTLANLALLSSALLFVL
ncbi:cell wall glucanosyltransferase mwg1 [Apiospora arundinis]|jgi:beta-glucanase (GH16 family)|uniref:Crh-like protein n=1 Tax=Apiospora arundinis TaxID=335852 RepID=A0ABR2I0F7_9PEZI